MALFEPDSATPTFAAIALAGAPSFLALRGLATGHRSPLDAVPEASFMVVHLDVATLRDSTLFRSVLGKDRIQALTTGCGFDPFTRIDEIDVAVPEAENVGDFGIAAGGAMTVAELTGC